MPSRWEITLPGVDAATVRSEHLHAVVSGWLDRGGGHHAQHKGYSVVPARQIDGAVVIEVGLVDDRLIDRLATHAAQGVRVRLGSQWSEVARSPRQVAGTPWHSLAASGPASAWCLRFVTPTTFRRGNAFTPSPALEAIIGSLRSRWDRFAPASIGPVKLDLSMKPLWITDIEVTSQVSKVGGLTVSGFTGRIRFACDSGDEVSATVDRLVRLAPYTGVGAHTTRGFGVTRPGTTRPVRPERAPA